MLRDPDNRTMTADEGDPLRFGPLDILRQTRTEAVARVLRAVEAREPLSIAICNAHTALTALDDPDYAATLRSMTLFNDGTGMELAGLFLEGRGFPENLNGTDFVPHLLADIGRPLRIFLLGARPAEVEGARAAIEARFPQHCIVGCRDGYFADSDIPLICESVSTAQADLLLVAMGNPRQETFIMRHRSSLDVPVAIGVGALFDFLSGTAIRAPRAMRLAGFEWLFRLAMEPKRLARRYLIGIPRFFLALAKLKLRRR